MLKRWLLTAAVALVCGKCPRGQAIAGAPATEGQDFFSYQVMIPMRDGIHLHTVIFIPKHQKEPLPILLSRTPYGVPASEKGFVDSKRYDELMADGYIFVIQDLRGRFKSEGQFVMVRPPRDRNDPNAIDESTDAYDTIDWLVKNVPDNNGRVGIFGVSYAGWTTVMALLDPHPALKAASEQATSADMFLGDDFHHNGAFRLSYSFEYATLVESNKNQNTHFNFDFYDTYEWYLKLGCLSNVNRRYLHSSLPTWNDFVHHPNYDAFWKQRAFATFLRKTTVPNLNVAGWWDQEDFYGPIKVYELLEQNDSAKINYLVAGPWNHGGWAHGDGRTLGSFAFGSDTSREFRENIQAPWFAYWLHGKGTLHRPEATVFETGTNEWKSYDSWPPTKGVISRRLFLHANRTLSFDPPRKSDDQFDLYVSDPANPVPYRPRPITPTFTGPDWAVWLLRDQRFVDHRPDVLSWETEALTQNIVVTGDIVADLFAATSGTDADWIVKLIDVFPENYTDDAENNRELGGYQLMIADEVLRGRFRNSFEKPEPIPSNRILEYQIDLHTNDHAFLKGHKIMVQVQSTWFPLIDRNPQTYVPSIFQAKNGDYKRAIQKIYRAPGKASSIILPIASE
jgi:putative CocE/NonD family hydrolase